VRDSSSSPAASIGEIDDRMRRQSGDTSGRNP
jgi:hypothetical protein